MRTSLSFWWPPRRVTQPDPAAMGYEAGYLPGTMEPVDTLGDTGNAPLDDAPAPQPREPRVYLWPVAVIFAVAATSFLAWALKR